MGIYVDESVYQALIAAGFEDYVGQDDEGYYVDYIALIDAGYAEEIGGAVYLISLRPSQKGMFIGNL